MFDIDCPFEHQTIFPFDRENTKGCYVWVATAIIGGSVVSALATSYGATKAADAQKQAAATAANTSLGMYNTTRSDLAPFRQIGSDASTQLNNRLGELTSPIDVTAQLNDPNSITRKAYDFENYQGLKSTQNSAAARGLGVSGAALKGAANFTTGLVNTTYKNLFDMANTNQSNAFNRLKSLVDTGENAAAQTGTSGTNAANTAASAQIASGNASAAANNAIGGSVSNIGNNIAGYAAFKGLYGDNSNSFNNTSSNRFSQGNNI